MWGRGVLFGPVPFVSADSESDDDLRLFCLIHGKFLLTKNSDRVCVIPPSVADGINSHLPLMSLSPKTPIEVWHISI